MKRTTDKEILSFLREVQRLQRKLINAAEPVSMDVDIISGKSLIEGERSSETHISVGVSPYDIDNQFTFYQFWDPAENEAELERLENVIKTYVKL